MSRDSIRKLADIWVEDIFSPSHLSDIDHERALNHLIDQILNRIVKYRSNSNKTLESKDQIMDIIKNDQSIQRGIAQLQRNYKDLLASQTELSDRRKQTDWAVTRDHFKSFLGKVVTAIFIAIIVLGTAYVAKELEILLPIVRVGV